LYQKGIFSPKYEGGFKILGVGEITKKVQIFAQGFSKEAQEKLSAKGIAFSVVGC
jgi:ribosomal protein L18E